jgi:hypothetical protein
MMVEIETLRKVKVDLGDLVWLDFTKDDLQTGYYRLGQHVSEQVHKILRQRIESQSVEKMHQLLNQARACKTTLFNKIEDRRIDEPIHSGLHEYMACLTAWSEGVGLASFQHPALAAGASLSAIDLAFFLQNDSAGCQTGMYRAADRSVILWHTEEDIEQAPGSGFDELRIASFKLAEGNPPLTMHAFIYPELLPGPAFGWRSDGYAQAADLLYIKPAPENFVGTLANIATWLTLQLGSAVSAGEVIRCLSPYYGGYALNVVQAQAGMVKAEKFEFGADLVIPYVLDNTEGSFLYQANIFTNGDDPRVKQKEALLPTDRNWFVRRLDYTASVMKSMPGQSASSDPMRFFHDLLSTQNAGGGSYSNKDVKAWFIYRQWQQGAEIWIGNGPALPNDEITVINIPLP